MTSAAITPRPAPRAITPLGPATSSASQGFSRATLDLGSASAATRPSVDVRTRLRNQATEFESVFLNSMFSQMYTGIDGDGPFGGSGGAGVWRSFLTDQYARSFARAGGIGIADHVYRSLLAQQEARSN